MIKKFDILLTSLCLLVIYKLKPLWEVVEIKIIKPLLPFFISFVIAYFLYPLKVYFKKKFGSKMSLIIMVSIIILIIFLFSFILIPLLYKEFIYFFSSFISLIKNISNKYDIDLSFFTSKIIENIDLTSSYNSLISVFVVICLTVYLLKDMEIIRNKIYIYFKNSKYFSFIKESDKKIKKYIKSITFVSTITFFEYFIFYLIAGHPYAFVLGILGFFLNMIPYFGGIIFGLIVLISSESKKMVIKYIIVIFITSIIDSYVINPISFKKSNDISPIISIMGVLLLGSLFGTIGVVLSMPILIVVKEYIKFCRIKN